MSERIDLPCHSSRSSLLSSSSGYNNYRGLLNLVYILLAMGGGRLVLENLLKYGLLVQLDLPIIFLKDPTQWSAFILILLVNIFIFITYYLEVKVKSTLSQLINLFMLLIFPVIYIEIRKPNPIGTFLAVSIYSIVFLKLISYIHINCLCRMQWINDNKGKKTDIFEESLNDYVTEKSSTILVKYPDNLSLKDLYYFLFAPTLCYELNYPRTTGIHKNSLVRRLCEILFLSSLEYILIQQWTLPILRSIDRPLNELSTFTIIEHLLRLAIANHLIWLIFFYLIFHSCLNVVADLLQFDDRHFYSDWWNAEDIADFWKKWNIPVHTWCKRHIYKPLIKDYGLSKAMASFFVFLISAFFHEYLISVPLRMFRIWSFIAILVQVPMAFIVKYMNREARYGNIAVWISLILLQPIAIILYLQDYYYKDYVQQN
ncbi:unnamed protein product [Didymodactylos carnosus]|uniref:O-acyltransferase n=1 Tax=Didymodactylos carnosus TaxID=1234261 RepID=A0A813RDN0_9BILA|nr:unnamed protein product [Didymodactylos carnosus]CAF0782248.1 unnamed protein product [Didymodactylos carnosus]CAF3508387.1 unnamed protein product [Didymodactylos carnosus]CAF3565691.1 unnamed protein product [Didymodactylos carnosus]